jgi:hypothetical protein
VKSFEGYINHVKEHQGRSNQYERCQIPGRKKISSLFSIEIKREVLNVNKEAIC